MTPRFLPEQVGKMQLSSTEMMTAVGGAGSDGEMRNFVLQPLSLRLIGHPVEIVSSLGEMSDRDSEFGGSWHIGSIKSHREGEITKGL